MNIFCMASKALNFWSRYLQKKLHFINFKVLKVITCKHYYENITVYLLVYLLLGNVTLVNMFTPIKLLYLQQYK